MCPCWRRASATLRHDGVVVPLLAARDECDFDVRQVRIGAERRGNDRDDDKRREQQGSLESARGCLQRFERAAKPLLQ